MTTTYDPRHPHYLEQADVRDELTRVFDVCHGCRRCVSLCTSFPTLFEMIDRRDEPDAGTLTPAEQDQVVGGCFQCTLCRLDCPYTPELHELNLDFPRLMLRAVAMQHDAGLTSMRSKAAARLLGHADLVGRIATKSSGIANKLIGSAPRSIVRRITAALTGVSPVRRLPRFATQRFSHWFEERPRIRLGRGQGRVTVFPTCLVEYQEVDLGKDLVRVYERNGIECANSGATCCGAPLLHAGDIERFAKVAERNVTTLANEIRAGTDIVVAQPTCSYVLTQEYPLHVGGADAALVAEHTYDAADYLMRLHRFDDTVLDTDFGGETVDSIAHHVPSHLRAQDIGYASRDLMMLTGARVTLIQQSAGVEGLWGLRAGNEDVTVPIGERLGAVIAGVGGDLVAGNCHLANTVIEEQSGRRVHHPLRIVANAYGIGDDTGGLRG